MFESHSSLREPNIIKMEIDYKDHTGMTNEEFEKLDYETKYHLTVELLWLEEEENYMLRVLLDELKKANNPFRYHLRILKIRLRYIRKKINHLPNKIDI